MFFLIGGDPQTNHSLCLGCSNPSSSSGFSPGFPSWILSSGHPEPFRRGLLNSYAMSLASSCGVLGLGINSKVARDAGMKSGRARTAGEAACK
jgi:hypothetical protein